MRRIIIALAVVIGLISSLNDVSAQKKNKPLDSSEKKKPVWVNGLEQGFIITTASSSTLDDAQQKALAKVKEQIISSVAENIQTSSDYFRAEVIQNDNAEFAESFSTATKTQAADIPFVKGISLSKVNAYYWEKYDQGGVKYYYHIKYPFSQIELKKLIMEFEKADREKTERLEASILKTKSINSVEEYSQLIKELDGLSKGFIDVDPRKNKADVASSTLKQKLRDVSIETVNSTLGEIRVMLRIGEDVVTTGRKPIVKSNCAKIVSVKNKSPEWIITYSYDECYEDPGNKVSIEFRNGYGKPRNEYFFNVSADKIDIFVNNDINFTGGSDKKGLLTGVDCIVPVTSKYASGFVIEKVILNFGKESPIIIDGINETFEGEGSHELKLSIEQPIDKAIYSAKKYAVIKGSVHYKSVKTGEKSVYKMYNQDITTAW